MENQALSSDTASTASGGGPPPISGSDRFRLLLHATFFAILATFVASLISLVTTSFAGELPPNRNNLLLFLLVDAGLLALSWLFLAVLDRRPARSLGLWFYPEWGGELLMGLGLGAGLIAVLVAAMLVFRLLAYESRAPISALGFTGGAAFLLAAAAFEEIAFRGYAFQRLVEALGPASAVTISSALFGLAHLHNPAATTLSTVNTMLAGALMAVGYLRTRGLWLPLGLHFAWNFTMGPLLSLPVSGLRPGAYLLASRVTGPAVLTGGGYGPEGSILMTAVCICAIVWLARTTAIGPSVAMREDVKW